MQVELDDQEIDDIIYAVLSAKLNNSQEPTYERFSKLADKFKLLRMARGARF